MWSVLFPLVADAGVLSLNPVFVSRFEALDADSRDDAERLRVALEKRLDSEFLLVRRGEVPAYEDYTAEVYLDSCPPGQIVGCAYVIGSRAQAEWSVTGTVTTADDGLDVSVTYVDVADGRIAFSFRMPVRSVTDPRLLDAVVEVLHRATEGSIRDDDIRGQVEDPREEYRRSKERAAMLAKSLEGLDIGARPEERSFEEIERPKLTADDLREYDDREEEKPWALLGLTQGEYLRFKNSGMNIRDWRVAAKGRAGRVVIGVGGGYGSGPFGIEYDGRRVLDRGDLSIVETEAIQGAFDHGSANGELTVEVGVLPWLEIGAVARTRSIPFQFRFYTEFQGEPETVKDFKEQNVPLWEVGARVNAVFRPAGSLHPTAGATLGAWSGAGIGEISEMPDGLDPIPAPGGVFFLVSPGVEVDVSKWIALYLHVDPGVRLGGGVVRFQTGAEALTLRAVPRGSSPITLEGAVGFRVKLPAIGGPARRDEE